MTVNDPEDCHQFFDKPALAFSQNEDLRRLFDYLLDPNRRFTFVLGAGVSLDAGLPSWSKLIDNMIEAITEKTWQREARLDSTDLMRKAEFVLQLAVEYSSAEPGEVIRDALFSHRDGKTIKNFPPGKLATVVATLCTWLDERVDIVTTNFDTLFEDALEECQSTSITSVPFSSTGNQSDDWVPGRSVLHLHGILQPNRTPTGDIILTESDFFRHGPSVRELITRQLKSTHVVFIGVSLTDPNLVGPLWDLANAKTSSDAEECFLLSVASGNSRSSHEVDSRAFSIKKTEYLRDVLGVRTIFFKSYGQQSQAINEASLAILDSDNYFTNNDPVTASRYGFRLQRALNASFKMIGCEQGDEFPARAHASALSDRLQSFLDSRTDDSITDILGHAKLQFSRSGHNQDDPRFAQFLSHFESEKLALFLWLRSRIDQDGIAEYGLRMVGTSAYQHRESWSLDRKANVSAQSRFPAGRAAFLGQTDITDFPTSKGIVPQLWGAAFAVPFSYYADDSEFTFSKNAVFDSVDVGVITLQSTNFSTESEDAPWTDTHRRSVMSVLTKRNEDRLKNTLASIGRTIVAVPPAP